MQLVRARRASQFKWLLGIGMVQNLLTVTGALAVVEHLQAHDVPGGAYTPARMIGPDLVTRLPGSGLMQIG